MADDMHDKYREERPTRELLSLDWDEIYSVLAYVDENIKQGKNVYKKHVMFLQWFEGWVW